MDKFFNTFNVFWAVIVSSMTALFGQLWILFAGLLVFNFVDWITGWRVAVVKKQCSSKIGATGILKKFGYWVVIAMSFYISFAFNKLGIVLGIRLDFLILIGWFVLANYLVNEARSILENLVNLNISVPKFLVSGLKVTSEAINNVADGKFVKKENEEE
ncbi:MAG: phage holin family protein [Burkholderiales bacterium]|nr:phage holin family protein [Burkholderiales bacterium]